MIITKKYCINIQREGINVSSKSKKVQYARSLLLSKRVITCFLINFHAAWAKYNNRFILQGAGFAAKFLFFGRQLCKVR